MPIDPVRVYESNGEVTKVLSAYLEATVANNQAVVTAVAGKRIRVMGWIAQSDTATVGTMQFKSASAGTMLTPPFAVPPPTAGVIDKLEIKDSGYFETVTGEGLYVDVVTGAINIFISYIVYVP